jgi:hypothetical protein
VSAAHGINAIVPERGNEGVVTWTTHCNCGWQQNGSQSWDDGLQVGIAHAQAEGRTQTD